MKKMLTFLLVFALLFSFFRFDLITVSAAETETKTQTESNVDFNETSSYSGNLINLYVESDRHSIGAKIDLIVLTSLSNEIVDITFSGEGFGLTDNFEIVDDEIHFSVSHISANENPQLTFCILLDNDDTLTGKLFGVVREGQLYVNPYAKFLAERAYQHYTGNVEQENELSSLSLTESLNTINAEEAVEVNATTSEPNTTVTGRILWTDNNGNEQPLRFCRIKIKRVDSLINTVLYEGYTDKDGRYYAELENNAFDGLMDLTIKIFASGTDIAVRDSLYVLYTDTIDGSVLSSLNNVGTGLYEFSDLTYDMNDPDEEKAFFANALQISQSAICASAYYETMKGSDIVDVDIIYPHLSNSISCSYLTGMNQIYMYRESDPEDVSLPSYASWDVITHEYGHHVAYHENLMDYTGSSHDGGDMAEHYKSHFLNDNFDSCEINCVLVSKLLLPFSEEDCKYEGSALAWGEGFPTFFGELAQQYFVSNYASDSSSIPNVADERYRDYSGINYSIEIYSGNIPGRGENSEMGVQRILYDLYDNSEINDPEAFDKINLGHQTIWNYIIDSQAKTLYQFIEYLKNSDYPKSQLTHLGAILEAHGLATTAPTIASVSLDSPYIEFVWVEPNEDGYYNARKFQVNFYNKDYNLIGSTAPQIVGTNTLNVGTITVDSQLWQTIISYPSNFYVSITMYECNGNINNSVTNEYTTSYESAYTMCFSPGHVHDYTHSYSKCSSSQHKSYCACGEFIYENHFFLPGFVYSNCRDCGYMTTSVVPVIKLSTVGMIIDNNSDEEN